VITTRRMAWISGLAIAAAGGMAACSKPAAPSGDLARDLDAAASAPALTLAPTSGRRDVISAVEQSPDARRAPAPARKQTIARPARYTPPARVAAPTPTPPPTAAVATVPAPVTTPATEEAAQSRRPVPVQQAHQGRYKTEAEVFRDAPFPITP
jgi:hypothetical protein